MTQQNPSLPPPVWRLRDQMIDAPEPVIVDWLFNEESLTRRLTQLSDNGFSVTPLQEGWQTLRADECRALELAEGSEGWVREVYLRGHGVEWVFARSVAARSALEHDGLHMDELGTRSLGELLFSDKAFQRGPMHVCRYPAHWLPAECAQADLWARRSRFSRGHLSILVAEIFLPALWQAVPHAQSVTAEHR